MVYLSPTFSQHRNLSLFVQAVSCTKLESTIKCQMLNLWFFIIESKEWRLLTIKIALWSPSAVKKKYSRLVYTLCCLSMHVSHSHSFTWQTFVASELIPRKSGSKGHTSLCYVNSFQLLSANLGGKASNSSILFSRKLKDYVIIVYTCICSSWDILLQFIFKLYSYKQCDK